MGILILFTCDLNNKYQIAVQLEDSKPGGYHHRLAFYLPGTAAIHELTRERRHADFQSHPVDLDRMRKPTQLLSDMVTIWISSHYCISLR